MSIEKAIMQRIEDKSMPEPNSGCWLWLASIDEKGYGRMYDPRVKKNRAAHKIVSELFHGPGNGLYSLHSCDTKGCVNPAHLRWGTHSDNVRDAVKRGKHRTQFPVFGEQHPTSKLSDYQVAEIRAAKGTASAKMLASAFGIHETYVQALWRGAYRSIADV